MKVIFLDIDGVLNYENCKSRLNGFLFAEDEKIALLKQIVDATDAKIVLSSTWRYGWIEMENEDSKGFMVQDFIALRDKIMSHEIELMSHTPSVTSGHRGTEIDMWLKSQNEEIESFVILDDEDDLEPYRNHWIQTSFENGLTQRHVDIAIKMLNDVGE